MKLLMAMAALLGFGCSSDDEKRCGADPDPNSVTIAMCNDNDAPLAGHRVFFQAADSSVVKIVDTDARGIASASMTPGGFVTVVGSQALFTVVDPRNGDVLPLTFVDRPLKTFDISIDTGDPENYEVMVSATGDASRYTSFPATSTLSEYAGETASFVVVSHDQTRAFVARSVRVTDHIDLTSSTFQATAPVTFHTATEIPSPEGTALCSTSATVIVPEGGINLRGNGDPFSRSVMVPGGDNSIAIWTMCRLQTFIDWGPYASDYTRDLTVHIPDVPLDPLPRVNWSFDVDQQLATWQENGGSVQPDFSRVTLTITRRFQNPPPHPVNEPDYRDVSWRWAAVAAHDGTSLRFPSLPADPANEIVTDYDYAHPIGLNPQAPDTLHADFTIGAGVPWAVVRTSAFLTYGVFALIAKLPTGSLNITYGGS
jgi:hypothetical protein